MYLEHYGFDREPFEIAPNPDFLFLSKAHKKAFTYLNYALWNKDTFTMLTGEIGSGKTILLQHLIKTMPSKAEVISLYQTQLTPYELLYTIAQKLQLIAGEDLPKPKLFQLINDYILQSTKNIVIVVDEAQSFSVATLEELRLLAGIDMVTAKTCINVILCGQPELKRVVEGGSLEQLNQRIKLRFHLTVLDFEETKQYISFRVNKAGQKLEIFTLDAARRIYEYTNGLPRLINVLADTALTCGYADGFYAISSSQVDDAAKELDWEVNYGSKSTPRQMPNQESNVVNFSSGENSALASGDTDKLLKILSNMESHLARIANSLDNPSGKSQPTDKLKQK